MRSKAELFGGQLDDDNKLERFMNLDDLIFAFGIGVVTLAMVLLAMGWATKGRK